MTRGPMPEPRMRDEFRRELRAKLLIEAQTALDPRTRRGASWTAWLRPAMAISLAGAVLLVGAGAAAAGSLPGDPAFALKQAFEDTQVALTFDDVQRVQLLAQIADRRLSDLQTVTDSQRSEKAPTASEAYADAVTRFRAAVDALQQAAPQDKADRAQDVADAARDKHDAILDVLEQKVPDDAKPGIERAKEEEHKDKGDNQNHDGKGPRQTGQPSGTRTPEPTRTPRATETNRSTERPETSRPATPTPRPSSRD